MVVADRPVHSQEEAGDLADAYASHMAAGYLEAEGVAKGNPAIKAGSKVKMDGIGTSFGGTYVVSSCTHLFQGTHGYRTIFSTSGRSARSLVDLMTPKSKRGWGNSVVIGLVTNNNDPENTGRVRVKYPALGDETEGWWAPVVAPNAGSLTRPADAAAGRRRGRDRLRARRRPPSLRARLDLERSGDCPAATWRSRTAPSRSSPTRRSRCTRRT